MVRHWPKYHLSTDILGDQINHKGLDKKMIEENNKPTIEEKI